MKKTSYLILLIFLVIISTQPIFSSYFISNYEMGNLLATFGYLLILYPLFLIYKNLRSGIEYKLKTFQLENSEIISEINRLKESTKNDFIFYEHTIDEPFAMISESLIDILDITPEDFKLNYKRYKASPLVKEAFDRVKSFEKNGIRVPIYQVELLAKGGASIEFEVNEYPIYNDHKELVKIWGVLHKVKNQIDSINFIDNSPLEKFNILYDNINDGIFLIKGDRFVDCNSKTLEIFKTSLDQILMYAPFSIKYSPNIQPNGKNSKEEALRRMKLAYNGHPQDFEWVHLKQDGEAFKAKVKLRSFNINDETFLIAIIKDLSAEEKLNLIIDEKQNIINILFKQSTNSILILNHELNIESFNNSFLKTFNIKELRKHASIETLFKSEELLELLNSNKTSLSNRFKLKMVDSDKNYDAMVSVIPLYLEKNPSIIIIIEEIIDNISIKASLNKNQANFEEIISNSRDILYKYNIDEKRYEYISKSVQDIFGYTSKELSEMTDDQLKSILHPSELNRANLLIAKLFDGAMNIEHDLEYRIIHKSGKTKWIRDKYSVVTDDNGKLKSIIGMVSDLSKEKDLAEKLFRKDQLVHILTESIDKGVTVIVNSKIEYVNFKLEKITGYLFQELNQIESLFILAAEEEKERLKDDYLKVMSGSTEIVELCYWLKTKNKGNIYIRNNYFSDPKKPQNRYVLTTDITNERIEEYRNNPSEDIKKELIKFLPNFK